MKKLLIFSAINGTTLSLILNNNISQKVQIDLSYFSDNLKDIKQKLLFNAYDYIYIRDPFHSSCKTDFLNEKLECIIKNSKNAYLVDGINQINDIYFEDKFIQYSLYSEFMPKTEILDEKSVSKFTNYIIKKRISSRSKGILFNFENLVDLNWRNYIIQERFEVLKEFRVYVIFNEILEIGSVKSSKTIDSCVKVLATEQLPASLIQFVKRIIVNNKFDLIGLDIIETIEGYKLLEINRSCAFRTFYKKCNINLGEIFLEKLLQK